MAKNTDIKATSWEDVIQLRSGGKLLDDEFPLENLKRQTGVAQMRADLETTSRQSIRKALVQTFKAHAKNSQDANPVPPITVARIRDGRKNWFETISGANRVQAANEAGVKTIRAHVLPGEYSPAEAIMLAAGTNNGQIAALTNNDKDYALYKIVSAMQDLAWEPNGDGKPVITGTMPDGEPMSYRKLADLTGSGSASISHTQFKNVLTGISRKAAHRYMVTHNEDHTVTLRDPREYDPKKDIALLEKKIEANRKDAATAAKRASEHAAAASAVADQIAAAKNATKDQIETANRHAKVACEAADAAAKAAKAAESARNAEKVQEHRDAAVKAESTARNNSDDSAKNLVQIKTTPPVEPGTATKSDSGRRMGHFEVFPKNAEKTADSILSAVTDTFENKKDAQAFLNNLGAALADRFALNGEAE